MRLGRKKQSGFTYLLLLVLLVIIGITSASSLATGMAVSRRDAENELLRIGGEYERAMNSYRLATPGGVVNRNPRSLDDLLRDPRYPGIKRHLRQIYVDPLTGSDAWGLVRSTDGSIAGIYSLAGGKPIRRDGFVDRWIGFNDAASYGSWCFGVDNGASDVRQAGNDACANGTAARQQ